MDQPLTKNTNTAAPGPQFVTVPLEQPQAENQPFSSPVSAATPLTPLNPNPAGTVPFKSTPLTPPINNSAGNPPANAKFAPGEAGAGDSKKRSGKGFLIGSTITMIILVVGVFAGYRAVQQRTNPPTKAGCSCGGPRDTPGYACIPDIQCAEGYACCASDQQPPPPTQGDCASKAGQTGGPCSGQYPTACGGDLCLTECRGGTWYLTGGTCTTPGDIIPPAPPPANSPAPPPPTEPPPPVGKCTNSGFSCGSNCAICPQGQCSNIYPGDVCSTLGATQCVGSVKVVCSGPLTGLCSLNYWAATNQVCDAPGGGGGNQCCIQNGNRVCNATCQTGAPGISWGGTGFTGVPANCIGQVYTCDGNTPGGCSQGGTAGTSFSPESPSMCGKTQQVDIECPDAVDGMSAPPDYFRSKYFSCTTVALKNCNEVCADNTECNTGLSCTTRPNGTVCWGTMCEASLPPAATPPPPPPPADTPPSPTPPAISAQCVDIRVYQVNGDINSAANWQRLDTTQLATLKSGNTVYVTTLGSVSNGTIDRARIRVNSNAWTVTNETANLKPKSLASEPNEYYIIYTIPPLTTTFTFGAEIHETTQNLWH